MIHVQKMLILNIDSSYTGVRVLKMPEISWDWICECGRPSCDGAQCEKHSPVKVEVETKSGGVVGGVAFLPEVESHQSSREALDSTG